MTTDPQFDRLRQLSEPGAILDPDLLARILEVLPDGVLVIDESGTVRFMNAQAELIFAYPRQDVLGEPIEMLLPDDVRERHVQHRRAFFADPRVRPMGLGHDLKGLRRTGEEVPLEINLSPVVTAAGIYAVAVVRRKRL